MRRGKHAPKHIRTHAKAGITHNLSRVRVGAKCQCVVSNGKVCGVQATFYGRAMRPTNPPTPRVEVFLCTGHAQQMRDLYGFNVHLLEGSYALLA